MLSAVLESLLGLNVPIRALTVQLAIFGHS